MTDIKTIPIPISDCHGMDVPILAKIPANNMADIMSNSKL